MKEREAKTLPGLPVLLIQLAAIAYLVYAFIAAASAVEKATMLLCVLGALALIVLMFGLFIVQPNRGTVLQLFGRYVGTERTHGLRYTNPFYSKRPVSLRVRNFESSKLKVNDIEGNPIEIATVVVWQVVDTAAAV